MRTRVSAALAVSLFSLLLFVGAGCSSVPTKESTSASKNANVSNANVTANTSPSIIAPKNESVANTNTSAATSVDTSDWVTTTDATYGFTFKHPSDYAASDWEKDPVVPKGKQALWLQVEKLSDMTDVSWEVWSTDEAYTTDRIGDGYGDTQETFKEERTLIATSDSVNSQFVDYTHPVVQLKNGLRAEVVIDGAEGIELMKQYTLYHGDYRLLFRRDAQDLVEKYNLTDPADDDALTADVPQEVRDRFAVLDAIVESLDLSGFQE